MPVKKGEGRPLRIAVDGRTIVRQRTGVGVYAERIVRALLAIDRTNRYTLFLAEPCDHLTAPNLQKILIPAYAHKGRNRYWDNILLPHFIENEGIDVFFSPAFTLPFLPRLKRFVGWLPLPKTVRLLLKIDQKVRYVVVIHDIICEHSPQYFTLTMSFKQRLIGRNAARVADRIIADSLCTKNDLVKFYGVAEDRVTVIYPEVDRNLRPVRNRKSLERIRHKYRLPTRYILYLGTIEPRKNVEGIVRGYAQLPEELRARYSLVISGGMGWKAEEIRDEIGRLAAKHDIRCLGYVDDEDVPSLYTMASLFVFPSFYEGFGYPPLEAMACGTPVITSNLSSLPEAVGDAAILVDPRNIDEIAAAMETVLTSPTLRRALRAKGFRQAAKFSWKQCARETLRVFID